MPDDEAMRDIEASINRPRRRADTQPWHCPHSNVAASTTRTRFGFLVGTCEECRQPVTRFLTDWMADAEIESLRNRSKEEDASANDILRSEREWLDWCDDLLSS